MYVRLFGYRYMRVYVQVCERKYGVQQTTPGVIIMAMHCFCEMEDLTELGSKIELDCMTTESQESSCLCLPRFESTNAGLSCTTS